MDNSLQEQQLTRLLQEARAAVAAVSNIADLEQLRIKYLGKKGVLT